MSKIKLSNLRFFVGTNVVNDTIVIIKGFNGAFPIVLSPQVGKVDVYFDNTGGSLSLTVREVIDKLSRKISIVPFLGASRDEHHISKYQSTPKWKPLVDDVLTANLVPMTVEEVGKTLGTIKHTLTTGFKNQENTIQTRLHPVYKGDLTKFTQDELDSWKKLEADVGFGKLDLKHPGAKTAYEAVKRMVLKNVLCIGKPATGKTFWLAKLAHELKLPYFAENFHASMNDETLGSTMEAVEGDGLTVETIEELFKLSSAHTGDLPGYIAAVNLKFGTKLSYTKFKRILSRFATQFTRPGMFVFEELNFAAMAMIGYLFSALDFKGELNAGGGITLRRHPNFVIGATMNHNEQGTGLLNRALKSRFNLQIIFGDVTQQDVILRAETHPLIGIKDKRFLNKLHAIYVQWNGTLDTMRGLNASLTYRNIENFLITLANIPNVDLGDAFTTTFTNALIGETNKKNADTIIKLSTDAIKELNPLFTSSVGANVPSTQLDSINLTKSSATFDSASEALKNLAGK